MGSEAEIATAALIFKADASPEDRKAHQEAANTMQNGGEKVPGLNFHSSDWSRDAPVADAGCLGFVNLVFFHSRALVPSSGMAGSRFGCTTPRRQSCTGVGYAPFAFY